MEIHPVREQVVREMHLRRWPLLDVPSVVHQWVTLVKEEDRAAELALLERRADAVDGNPPHRAGTIGGDIAFTWERHSEGSSLAIFSPAPGEPDAARWLAGEALAEAVAWVESMPGQLIRAVRVFIVRDDSEAEKLLPELDFSRPDMVSCYFQEGARLWSDFRLRKDGFGRLLIAANGTDRRDLTRAAQRLQELGNYRNKALLGLPLAQSAWPQLNHTEEELTSLAKRLIDGDERDDVLMEELSRLSIELIAIATGIGFRMSATAAYGRLVEERLEQLQIKPIAGFASLVDFTNRRLLPAIRTCDALQNRERQLSERTTKLSSLLRARIETRIENQNGRLLRSMERSNAMQVRLQQLVEGLSVVALSYYALGLIGYLVTGFMEPAFGIETKTVLAILVVPLTLAVWITVRIAKRRLLGTGD